ncbi:hypothetical protein [Herbidospora sp. RD11066]
MSTDRLKYHQIAMLLVLMAERRPDVLNTTLTLDYRLRITPKLRDALEEAKLIERGVHGRVRTWTLTEAGRERALEEVREGFPVPASATLGLAFLKFLQNQSGSVAPSAAPSDAPLSHDEVEERIRQAYNSIEDKPGGWLHFAKLRPLLTDIDRAEQDAVLLKMLLQPDVRIVPESVQRAMSQEERDAALYVLDEANHMIMIGAR